MPIMLMQDEATFDGNFRRTLAPMYATLAFIRAEYRNQPWARILVGYSVKPKGIGKGTYQERKRALLCAAMAMVLKPLKRLEKMGV